MQLGAGTSARALSVCIQSAISAVRETSRVRVVLQPLPHAQGGAGHPLLLPLRAGKGEESADPCCHSAAGAQCVGGGLVQG